MQPWKNQLFFGDNLEILRGNHIPVGSVDLIYLDPPFNSNATYNILFAEKSGEKSAAQITAFEDTCHWGEEAAAGFYVPEQFPELRFPRLQILTVAELLAGKQLAYPRWVPPKTFKMRPAAAKA
ncbi:MAG: hypothetical protein WBW55_00840 [Desulfobaccales bacterium]